MANSLPVAVRQLLGNPALPALFVVMLAAFALLSRFLLTRRRGWRWRDMTPGQTLGVLALLDIIVGMGWALSYASGTVYGTFMYYVHAAAFFGFWLLAVAVALVAPPAATRALARRGRRLKP